MEDIDEITIDPKEQLKIRIANLQDALLTIQEELVILLEQEEEMNKPHKIGFNYSHKQDVKA